MSFSDLRREIGYCNTTLDQFSERSEKTIDQMRILTEERMKEIGLLVERQVSSLAGMAETIEHLDTQLRAGAARQAQAVHTLLSGQGFSYLFDIWLAQAVANPADPGLGMIENYIRTWTSAGMDVDFGSLRRMIRKRTEDVQKRRGRDARLTQEELADLLNEVTGR